MLQFMCFFVYLPVRPHERWSVNESDWRYIYLCMCASARLCMIVRMHYKVCLSDGVALHCTVFATTGTLMYIHPLMDTPAIKCMYIVEQCGCLKCCPRIAVLLLVVSMSMLFCVCEVSGNVNTRTQCKNETHKERKRKIEKERNHA